jgi:hypothetical protein
MPLKLVAIGAQAPPWRYGSRSQLRAAVDPHAAGQVWAEFICGDEEGALGRVGWPIFRAYTRRRAAGTTKDDKGQGGTRAEENRWVLGIPGLLLLELFAVVLFTVDTGTAVTVLFTGDEDLFLAVAGLLPAGRKVGRGGGVRRRDLTTFPPVLVVGEVEVELLVGSGGGGGGAGLALLLLVVVAVRRGEDAEGDGDSRFKIQVDCLVWARRVVLLSTS